MFRSQRNEHAVPSVHATVINFAAAKFAEYDMLRLPPPPKRTPGGGGGGGSFLTVARVDTRWNPSNLTAEVVTGSNW